MYLNFFSSAFVDLRKPTLVLTLLLLSQMHQVHLLENELLAVRLESQNLEEHLTSLAFTQKALNDKIADYNKTLTLNQAKLSSLLQDIEQNWAAVNHCNKKIAQITLNTEVKYAAPTLRIWKLDLKRGLCGSVA